MGCLSELDYFNKHPNSKETVRRFRPVPFASQMLVSVALLSDTFQQQCHHSRVRGRFSVGCSLQYCSDDIGWTN